MMLEYNQQFQTETQTLSQALELLNNPGLLRLVPKVCLKHKSYSAFILLYSKLMP